MKTFRLAVIPFVLTLCWVLPTLTAAPREQLFNDGWRFILGNPDGAEKSDFPDAGWRTLNLPHDWSIEGDFVPSRVSSTAYLPGGTGWYRKHFILPPDTKGRRVFLRFEGVYRDSDVWLNGEHLGARPNGYLPFEYDLTTHLCAPGEENVVAVRVERENIADSRWYPGTGIYRDTWLTVTDPIHVTRDGTFVTTPMVDDERAEVNSTCEVRNDSPADAIVTVTAAVLAADGQAAGKCAGTHAIAADGSWIFSLYHPVAKPHRWDLDDPYLYQVVHTVSVDGRTTDEMRTPLGIRVARFDANQGFFLNERHVLLKGVCIHHEAGNLGSAVTRAVLERRLRILKGIGVNTIRCSHNPMADDLYTLCDSLGLLVNDEEFDEWEIGKYKWEKGFNYGDAGRFGYSEYFEEWCVRDVEDSVRRSRRHPCVILYSIGNEIDTRADPYMHPRRDVKDDPTEPSMTRLAAVAPTLIAAVKRQDPTRPVTMALANVPAANEIGLASMLDVAGYNYQEKYFDADHARFPSRAIYSSEADLSAEKWFAVTDRPFVSGQILWVGFDFLGEADRWPQHGSRAGLFDTAGFVKPNGLRREALWSEKPVLHLRVFRGGSDPLKYKEPHHWNELPGDSRPAQVVAFTNLAEVTLILNGRSIGTLRPAAGIAQWPVPWEKGRLEISGETSAGETLHDAVETTGAPCRIRLRADRPVLTADGRDAVHVEIDLLDAEGQTVTDADKEVSVRAEGPLRLLAVESGNQSDNIRPRSTARSTWHGKALAILQSSVDAGTATVKVASPGMPEVEIKVETHQ